MKPWEEIWTYSDLSDVFDPSVVHGPENRGAREKLALAAPEMARMLLQIQHSPTGYDHEPCCPVCGLPEKSPRKDWPHGHAPDCELLAVLRKAGVLT